MREIKFRAWNECGKCWITFGCSRYCFNNGVDAKEKSMDVRTINGQVVATPHKEEDEKGENDAYSTRQAES